MRYSSSEQIHRKWTNISEKKYSLRSITNKDLKVPEKPMLKCLGFTYNGHSMATANLNKSEDFVTNTTAASKYIPIV